MKSVMTHQFSRVPSANIQRSSFDRSHGLKTTFDAGFLVPIFVDEALPGDTFNLKMSAFARLATPIHPVMDNMFMDTFFFAVPYRLVWDNWEKFNGEQEDPTSSTDYLIPTIEGTDAVTGTTVGSLWDYFGLPIQEACNNQVSALPFRAFNLIYNEWFRDQNLQDSYDVLKDDGPDNIGTYGMIRRGKRHDYFTSCLPWPQKGDSVMLPIGDSAPVTGIGKLNQTFPSSFPGGVYETGGTGATVYSSEASIDVSSANLTFVVEEDPNNPGFPGIYANLAEATASTINQIRQAFQLQKMLERDARGGTRYTEIIRAHFGVTSPDARLQRPEYLGGGSTPVNITPIPQTAPQSGDSGVLGDLGAMGIVSFNNHGFVKSFTEHCIIIGIVNVRADLTYQQRVDRMWTRQTRYDFYWPALAHIGEQAVLNKELWYQGTPDDDDVFGYQERYAEYRYKPSMITGLFRSQAPTTLDSWHLSQNFTSRPVLNSTFIEDNPPVDRVIAVPSEPHFIFDSYFSLRCARPMPVYGVPGLIDHF